MRDTIKINYPRNTSLYFNVSHELPVLVVLVLIVSFTEASEEVYQNRLVEGGDDDRCYSYDR